MSKIKEQSDYFLKAGFETYSKGADIYCLFYELGGRILRSKGIITFITSNSWLRSIYGEQLKSIFVKYIQPVSLMNIEDIQIFDEATVESSILTLQKEKSLEPFPIVNLSKDYKIGNSLAEYFHINKFNFSISETSDWFIGRQSEGLLKKKVEQIGTKLKDFKIEINRGFLTGLNEAFLIDEKKRSELINYSNKNKEILKPILRGRDIQKYSYEFGNVYLINSHNGLKSQGIEKINLQGDYFSIFQYLSSFSPKIEERYDQGDHWSNLRNCAYLLDFEKPKIVWGEISDKPKFAFDDGSYFTEATAFLMTGEKLKYLLAVLNSKVSEWYFNLIGTTTGMGTNRWKKYKIELLPIKEPTKIEEKNLERIVNDIINIKKQNPSANTTDLESQIDQLVYQLYELTPEEINIVEGSVK